MGWVGITKWIILVGGLLVALTLAALTLLPALPAKPVRATIIGIYPEPYAVGFPPTVRIVGRTFDGRIGSVSVRTDQIGCRIGETIPAWKEGISLRLDQASCRRVG